MKTIPLLIAVALTTPGTARPAPRNAARSIQPDNPRITSAAPVGDPGGWIGSDDYPADAMRSGSTGVVNFTLAIDEMGKVTDCSVTESSRNQILDDATCALMMARARFTPARDDKGQPVASTFHKKVNWQLPHDPRELWTVDQIRFPTPKDVKTLAPLVDDHSMNAVVKRLKSLGVAFERSTVQLDTITLPDALVAQVNDLAATEPFVFPRGAVTTINLITARKTIDFNGTAAKPVPLQSPLSTQVIISYDVDPAGKPGNCLVKGEAPVWMAGMTAMCKAMDITKPTFSTDAAKQTRHVVMTLQVSVTSAGPSEPLPPAK